MPLEPKEVDSLQGNQSQTALYERYGQVIFGYLRLHMHSLQDAEDLLLDVFLAALEHNNLAELSPGEQLAWLRRVAHNKLVNVYRQVSRSPQVVLLPEEQAYPDFVQELQTTYRMKPEEKQVLTRVHERLAQRSHPHSLLEPVQAGGLTRPPQLLPTVSPPSRPTTSRQKWLRHLNTLVAVLFVGLLVATMLFTFFSINRTRVGSPPATVGLTNDIRVLLVPAEKGSAPSQAEMEATRTFLSQRFISFGLQGSSVRVLTVNGQPGILVQLPHFGGNEQQTIGTLLETGALAFWDTGPYATVPVGMPFNPGPYTQYNPGSKPRFTNQDLDPSTLAVFRDPGGLLAISCMMKGDAINRFQLYTANNIGHALTITLDGKVIESAIIHSSIAGPFEVSADFTQQQASALASVLKYGPLPVELKKLV